MRYLIVVGLALASAIVGGCGSDDSAGSPTPEGSVSASATAAPGAGATATPTPTSPPVAETAPLTPQAAAEADGIRVILAQVLQPWLPDAATPAAPAGSHYVLIAVTIENRSRKPVEVGYNTFAFVGSQGETPGVNIPGADPYLTRQTLAPRAVVQGFVAGILPDDGDLTGVRFDADPGTDAHVTFEE